MMNTITKRLIGTGSVALFLAAAPGAHAALNLVFDTDGSTPGAIVDSTGTVSSRGLGVGYDPSNFQSKFPNSATAATSQSVFSPLITDSSAAGTFSTILAGSQFQLGLHAYGNNVANPTQPVTLLASLFQYNPNAAAGTVPITGSPIFSNLSVSVLDTADQTDHTYLSNVITLANPIVANTEYVLAVFSDPSNPIDFGTADRSNFATSGLPSGDNAIYRQYFLTDNNSGAAGGTAQTVSGGLTQPLGYQFYASAAPEPSEVATSGLIVFGLGAMLLAARKRKAALTPKAE